MSDHQSRILYLDGWRGLAIAGVLVAHFGTAEVINLGRFGVELFFVLSGRLMAEILFVRATPLRRFFPRRVSRVWPALFVFVLISLGAGLSGIGDATWASALAAVTFTTNYAYLFGVESEWLGHTWSLAVEEHLYIVLGLIAWGTRGDGVKAMWAMTALTGAMFANGIWQTLGLGLDYYEVYWRSDVRGASILLGAVAHLAFRRLNAPGGLAVICGLAGLALNFNVVPDPIKYTLGSVLVAVAVASLPSSWTWVRAGLASKPALALGAISYSLYLWQQPFSKSIAALEPTSWYLTSAGLCLCAIAVAWVSWRWIEGPARKYLNRRWTADA